MIEKIKDKKANIVEGTFICVIIIMVAFCLMQMTYLLNSHYKATRAFEHSMTLLETSVQRDVYQSLSNFTYSEYKPNGDLKKQYLAFLQKNEELKYDENSNSYIGDNFIIKADDINIKYKKNGVNGSSFDIEYTVTSKITYTLNMFFTEEPIKFTTGNINFTSKYTYVNDVGSDSNLVNGNDSNSSKYQDN